MSAVAASPELHRLPLIYRGKVRDLYAADDRHLLMVASDRLSAFDVILPTRIPGKGAVLTAVSISGLTAPVTSCPTTCNWPA